MQKFFVDTDGNFIGSYDGPIEDVPDVLSRGIEVPNAPLNVIQKWHDGKWLDLMPIFKPIPRYDFWRAVDEGLKLKKDQVLAAIETSNLDDAAKYSAKLGITDAQTYIRDDPNVVSLLSLMGFPAHEADDFWLWAQPA